MSRLQVVWLSIVLSVAAFAGILPAANAQILVSDYINGQIVEYNNDGSYNRLLDAGNSAQLMMPTGISFGKGTDLYVSSLTGSVLRYDWSTGEYKSPFASIYPSYAGGVLFDRASNSVFVSNYASPQIARFDADTGAMLGAFGMTSGAYNFSSMTMGPDGKLYASDWYGSQVFRFDPANNYASELFAANDAIHNCNGLVFDKSGNLDVVGMALPYNVYQFDFNGAPIGTLIDGLSFPSGITRDLDGSLLVTSMGDDKVNPPVPGFIGKYAPDGSAINASFITSFPGPILGQPSAVLVERSTSYWTGGAAGNVNWNVAGNWDVSKPDNHAAVVFGATAPGGHAENFNNFNPGTRFNGITFTADAPSYTLQGNAIDLAGAVSNQSANVQTIDLDMNLIEPGDYLFYAGGDLAISGNLSGVGSLIKRGPGTLTLAGDATYSGITTVADGTLIVGVIDDLPWIWVQDGGQLTATSIVADSLTIGGTSNIEAVVAVPEPSSMVLVLFGGMSIFIFGRRRHST